MRKDRHKQDDEVAGDGKAKKDSTTNILMPDSTGLPQKSHVHALRGRGRPTQDQTGGFNVVAYDEYLKGWND